MLIFIECLLHCISTKQQQQQQSVVRAFKDYCNKHKHRMQRQHQPEFESPDISDEAVETLKFETYYRISQRARTRWFLAYTLIRNPMVSRFRLLRKLLNIYMLRQLQHCRKHALERKKQWYFALWRSLRMYGLYATCERKKQSRYRAAAVATTTIVRYLQVFKIAVIHVQRPAEVSRQLGTGAVSTAIVSLQLPLWVPSRVCEIWTRAQRWATE